MVDSVFSKELAIALEEAGGLAGAIQDAEQMETSHTEFPRMTADPLDPRGTFFLVFRCAPFHKLCRSLEQLEQQNGAASTTFLRFNVLG